MNWNDLEAAWRHQAPSPQTSSEVAAIVRDCADRQRKMDRFLFWSDVRGSIVCFGLAVYFGRLTWKFGSAAWPMGVAAVLFLVLGGFMAAELKRARRLRGSPASAMTVMLAADLESLQRRRWLLRHVALWFLTPMIACLALIVAAGEKYHASAAVSGPLRWVVCGAGAIIVMGITWLINQHYARTRVEPQIAALERLRHSLLSTNS